MSGRHKGIIIDCPLCPLMGITFQGLTIWLNDNGLAPGKKFLWINYNSNDEKTSGFPEALLALGYLAPSFKLPGYLMRLDHDVQNSCVSLWIEPRDSNAVSGI